MRNSNVHRIITPGLKQGSLLCSTPVHPDQDMQKSLVLITRHNQMGTTGIVLNNPMGVHVNIRCMNDVYQGLELHLGGPVDDRISFLVSLPSFYGGWRDSTCWIRDCHQLGSLLNLVSAQNISIMAFKGSVNWLPEEIDHELSNRYWWLTNDYSFYDTLNKGKHGWRSVAKRLGGHYRYLIDEDLPVIYN